MSFQNQFTQLCSEVEKVQCKSKEASQIKPPASGEMSPLLITPAFRRLRGPCLRAAKKWPVGLVTVGVMWTDVQVERTKSWQSGSKCLRKWIKMFRLDLWKQQYFLINLTFKCCLVLQSIICTMGLKWYPHPELLHCIKGCEVRTHSGNVQHLLDLTHEIWNIKVFISRASPTDFRRTNNWQMLCTLNVQITCEEWFLVRTFVFPGGQQDQQQFIHHAARC